MTRSEWNRVCRTLDTIGAFAVVMLFLWWLTATVWGKDNGQFDKWKSGDATKDFLMHQWFEGLRSDLGLCCSFADGEVIEDVDYDTHDGHFRVFLDGQWYVIEDRAVITVPNKFGKAVVWPIRYDGKVSGIRCFMPGAGT